MLVLCSKYTVIPIHIHVHGVPSTFILYCSHTLIVGPTIRLLSVDNDEEDDNEEVDGREGGGNELLEDGNFTEDDGSLVDEDDRLDDDNVNKKLMELVEVVHVCLEANPGMQSTLLINASKNLLKTYKSKL